MKTRRGFTLMELIVVITVLGILTLVMVPIIANSINYAKIENDKVLVDNMNNILETDAQYNGIPTSVDQVLWIFTGNGLEINNTNYKKHAFYWDKEENKIIIYDTEKEEVIYPENLYLRPTDKELQDKINGTWFPIAGDYKEYEEHLYKITYYVNGKKIKFHDKTSYDGTKDIELPKPTETDGYVFSGWFTNEKLEGTEVEKIEKGLNKDLVFYATFVKKPTDCTSDPNNESCKDPTTIYSITYHTNGGTLTTHQTSYKAPLTEAFTLPEPERYGYYFMGWYTTYNFEKNTKVEKIEAGSTGNKVFYALWQKDPSQFTMYDITYVLNGGVLSNDAPYEYEGPLETAITLPTPERRGYIFLGWYDNPDFTGNTCAEIGLNEYGDKALYAKWEKDGSGLYYITYELNGGILYDPPYELKGDKDLYLFTPLKRGYEFKGWYDETNQPISMIPKEKQNENYTLSAKWEAIKYDINYNLNGGTWDNSNTVNYTYTIEKSVKYTQEVTKEGYGLAGWYDNPECNGSPVISTQIGDTGEKTLYAKWEPQKYTIYYMLYVSINEDDKDWTRTFTIEDTVTLPTPTAEGYTFQGWYTTDNFEKDTKVEIIPEGYNKSIILYACWLKTSDTGDTNNIGQ